MNYYDEFKSISISGFLTSRGLEGKSRGSKTWFSSPFSSDSTPSFVVYEKNNTFYDFSNGFGGDIIRLVMLLENCDFLEAVERIADNGFTPIQIIEDKPKKVYEHFDIKPFICKDKSHIWRIEKYANSRRITRGYKPSIYSFESKKNSGERIEYPSLGFVKQAPSGMVIGLQMRYASHKTKRFKVEGNNGIYLATEDPLQDPENLFLVESETSANSLNEILQQQTDTCVVMSMGGVSVGPIMLDEYGDVENKFVIIDYDGNEELYQQRIQQYEDSGLIPIKIPFKKGEDINSVYIEGKEDEIFNIIKPYLHGKREYNSKN